MTDLTTMTKAVPLIAASQWRIETIQLVNWGGFHHRPATFAFHPEATIVTGASGVGKSTVLDAYLALLMPSDVPFNGASNAANAGRARSAEQRSLLTYLRGKTDDVVEDGHTVDKVLRGRGKPTWGAIAATFTAETGDRYTVLRAYFAPTSASRDGEIVKRMMTIPGAFEVRELAEFARIGAESFPAKPMKAKWPELRIHGSYDEFSQALFSRLGIGQGGDGEQALKLLARIQSGIGFRTVDELYKKLVIERPETFTVADEAIATFDELDEMYRKMEMSQQQADLLAPITGLFEQMMDAQRRIADARRLGSVRAVDTPAGLWRLRTHAAVLGDEETSLREKEATTREQLASAMAAAEEAVALLDAAKADYDAGGGDKDRKLSAQIAELEQTAEDRRTAQSRLEEPLAVLGRSADTEQELVTIHAEARAFPAQVRDSQERLEKQRERMIRDEWPTNKEISDLTEEIRSLDGRTGRVDDTLDKRRRLMADASGIDAGDLPFVAELIDIAEGEEKWRGAIETVLHASARTILVPEEHYDRFSRDIDHLRFSPRVRFKGVRRGLSVSDRPLDPEKLAGKLNYRVSPYQGWVIEHVTGPYLNALCVNTAAELAGDGLRVTASGQTRRGTDGAHGENASRPIIGFDNVDLKASLGQHVRELQGQLKQAENARIRIETELTSLGNRALAYQRTLDFTWTQVDVDSPTRQATELRAVQAALLAADGALAALKRRMDRLRKAAENAQRRQHGFEVALDGIVEARGDLATLIDSVNAALWPLEQDASVSLDDTLAARLDEEWAAACDGEPVSSATWERTLRRLETALSEGVTRSNKEEEASKQALERIFHQFQERWYHPNRSDRVAAYREYEDILDEITRSGIHKQREQWRRSAMQWSGKSLRLLGSAMASAVDEIQDRLDSVNIILEALPFGPTDGRIRIDLRRLHPQAVTTFRRDLAASQKIATSGATDDEMIERFQQMRSFIARIRTRDDRSLTPDLADLVAREEILDVRRHVEITAKQLDETGEPVAEYMSLAGKSGGEMQELVAFIVGAALRFQLGDELGHAPRFAPVFLDEGFIKADSEFAGRAVEAWKGLGFQLIVGAPLDKYTGLERHVARTLLISKNRDTGHAYIDHAYHEGAEVLA